MSQNKKKNSLLQIINKKAQDVKSLVQKKEKNNMDVIKLTYVASFMYVCILLIGSFMLGFGSQFIALTSILSIEDFFSIDSLSKITQENKSYIIMKIIINIAYIALHVIDAYGLINLFSVFGFIFFTTLYFIFQIVYSGTKK